jgi:hypothetical protein
MIRGIPDKNIARQKKIASNAQCGLAFFEGGFDAQKAYRVNDNCFVHFDRKRSMGGKITAD